MIDGPQWLDGEKNKQDSVTPDEDLKEKDLLVLSREISDLQNTFHLLGTLHAETKPGLWPLRLILVPFPPLS